MELKRRKKKGAPPGKNLKKDDGKNGDVENFEYLRFIAKDFLADLGHPNKIMYENTNENMAMKKLLRKALERSRYKDIYLFKLHLEYSKEIKSSSIYLAKNWDDVNKRQINPEDLEIFRNIEFFVEFLVKSGEIDLLRKFNEEVKKRVIKELDEPKEKDYEIVED